MYKDKPVYTSEKHYTTETGYKYAVRARPWDRLAFDEIAGNTLQPYALDDPFGEPVLEMHAGRAVKSFTTAASKRGWTAYCQVRIPPARAAEPA